jgi:hypothetical protein
MPQVFTYPTLVAAIDESKGMTEKGYTFLDRDQKELFSRGTGFGWRR